MKRIIYILILCLALCIPVTAQGTGFGNTTILLDSGITQFDETLIIDRNNFILEGRPDSVIATDLDTAIIIRNCENITLRNFTIKGTEGTINPEYDALGFIQVDNVVNLKVENVEQIGSPYNGFSASNTTNTLIRNSTFKNNGQNGINFQEGNQNPSVLHTEASFNHDDGIETDGTTKGALFAYCIAKSNGDIGIKLCASNGDYGYAIAFNCYSEGNRENYELGKGFNHSVINCESRNPVSIACVVRLSRYWTLAHFKGYQSLYGLVVASGYAPSDAYKSSDGEMFNIELEGRNADYPAIYFWNTERNIAIMDMTLTGLWREPIYNPPADLILR